MVKIYLASPYSGTKNQEQKRFEAVCKLAGEILGPTHHIFSPIAHSHPIAIRSELPVDHDFWIDFNRTWLEWADEVWVAMIPGWKESAGVQWEVEWAKKSGKNVRYLNA